MAHIEIRSPARAFVFLFALLVALNSGSTAQGDSSPGAPVRVLDRLFAELNAATNPSERLRITEQIRAVTAHTNRLPVELRSAWAHFDPTTITGDYRDLDAFRRYSQALREMDELEQGVQKGLFSNADDALARIDEADFTRRQAVLGAMREARIVEHYGRPDLAKRLRKAISSQAHHTRFVNQGIARLATRTASRALGVAGLLVGIEALNASSAQAAIDQRPASERRKKSVEALLNFRSEIVGPVLSTEAR